GSRTCSAPHRDRQAIPARCRDLAVAGARLATTRYEPAGLLRGETLPQVDTRRSSSGSLLAAKRRTSRSLHGQRRVEVLPPSLSTRINRRRVFGLGPGIIRSRPAG